MTPILGGASRPRPIDLARLAASLYREAPPFRRLLMTLRPFLGPFDRLLELVPEDASVLDVGCGAGLFLGLLAGSNRRFRGLGFDASPGAIEAARAMAGRAAALGLPATLRFECLDVAAPWPAGPFDVVSLVDVMHHVPPRHRRQLIASCRAALRPGGTLIYKDIGERPVWRATANRLHDLLMAREWVSYTPIRELEEWTAEIGLTIAPVERINRLWYGHDLVLLKRPEAA